MQKGNTRLLLVSGILLGGGLFAPTFTAAREARNERLTQSEEIRTDLVVAVGAGFTRLMYSDRNRDGRLSREELTDTRLHHLFDRTDANSDGSLTREELTAMFHWESTPLYPYSSARPDVPYEQRVPPPGTDYALFYQRCTPPPASDQ
jgi:hypothetical protein